MRPRRRRCGSFASGGEINRQQNKQKRGNPMRHFIKALCAIVMIGGASQQARSQDVLKVAIPQRGAWDAGVTELGERGGIFKKHGLKLDILFTQAGPESIQAGIGGRNQIATPPGGSGGGRTLSK